MGRSGSLLVAQSLAGSSGKCSTGMDTWVDPRDAAARGSEFIALLTARSRPHGCHIYLPPAVYMRATVSQNPCHHHMVLILFLRVANVVNKK